MEINTNKSETMIISTKNRTHNIQIGGKLIEQVKRYKYLGCIVEESGNIGLEINE